MESDCNVEFFKELVLSKNLKISDDEVLHLTIYMQLYMIQIKMIMYMKKKVYERMQITFFF